MTYKNSDEIKALISQITNPATEGLAGTIAITKLKRALEKMDKAGERPTELAKITPEWYQDYRSAFLIEAAQHAWEKAQDPEHTRPVQEMDPENPHKLAIASNRARLEQIKYVRHNLEKSQASAANAGIPEQEVAELQANLHFQNFRQKSLLKRDSSNTTQIDYRHNLLIMQRNGLITEEDFDKLADDLDGQLIELQKEISLLLIEDAQEYINAPIDGDVDFDSLDNMYYSLRQQILKVLPSQGEYKHLAYPEAIAAENPELKTALESVEEKRQSLNLLGLKHEYAKIIQDSTDIDRLSDLEDFQYADLEPENLTFNDIGVSDEQLLTARNEAINASIQEGINETSPREIHSSLSTTLASIDRWVESQEWFDWDNLSHTQSELEEISNTALTESLSVRFNEAVTSEANPAVVLSDLFDLKRAVMSAPEQASEAGVTVDSITTEERKRAVALGEEYFQEYISEPQQARIDAIAFAFSTHGLDWSDLSDKIPELHQKVANNNHELKEIMQLG